MDFANFVQHILSPKEQLLASQIDKVVQDAKLNEFLREYPPSDPSTLKEPELYPFVAIANRILECLKLHQIEFCRDDPKIVCGSHLTTANTKKSDVKRESTEAYADANKRIKFNNDECGKPRDNNPVQCASYALEMMSYGGFRSHVISCLVTNSFLEIAYYDHSAVIMSRAIDFKKDLRSFIQFLHAFVSGGESVWGYHSILKEPQTGFRNQERAMELQELARAVCVDAFKNFTLRLQDGKTLILGTTVYQAHGLIGRGTLVVRATMPTGNKMVIVKLSHLPKTRTSESEIIDVIREASRRASRRTDGRIMANHLPNVIHAEVHEYGLDTPQGRLAEYYKDDNNTYELRDLCILVQEELEPITNLTTADELASAFREIFEAYRWLCEDVKIMHRDISINNLMVRHQDGRHYGVLNDFDMAKVNNDLLPTSKQRTGTKPFMARDLLDVKFYIEGNPPRHLYRYDLESLFYVLVFLTTHYNDGKEIRNPPLERWYDMDTRTLLAMKRGLSEQLPPLTPAFESLTDWVLPMSLMFSEGYVARTRHKIHSALDKRQGIEPQRFCTDTFEGKVTFDTFSAILDRALK